MPNPDSPDDMVFLCKSIRTTFIALYRVIVNEMGGGGMVGLFTGLPQAVRGIFGVSICGSLARAMVAILNSRIAIGREQCEVLDVVQGEGPAESGEAPQPRILFINGIATTSHAAREGADYLGKVFRNDRVTLVYNRTNGFLVDLFECVMGKLRWIGASVPCLRLIAAIRHALLDTTRKEKVVLIAHSHGTIIAANAIAELTSWAQFVPGAHPTKKKGEGAFANAHLPPHRAPSGSQDASGSLPCGKCRTSL